jgi:hypothetical protein
MDGEAAAEGQISALFSMGCFSPINEFVASAAAAPATSCFPSKLQAKH